MMSWLMFLDIIAAVVKLSMIIMVGIYFIFSNTIIAVLRQTKSGADIMVEINRVILNAVFLCCFVISGLGSLHLALFGDGYQMISGCLFFFGTTLLTIVINVPLNNQLRDTNGAEQRRVFWRQYQVDWLRWNHVRTLCASVAGLLLVIQ
ncbi:membrane protein [Neiella marina]|uniref:Membrane protein n=1 Tax=Neiella marina TaxID=508461 RepID=A0A8J2U3R2_9GAMM|nr:anthrone oxygenase family protein [Neiella marina]GGA71777.1 membrane protein [Neiella marina]